MVFNHQPSGYSQSGVHMLMLSLKVSSSAWVGALVPVELRGLTVAQIMNIIAKFRQIEESMENH